MQESATLVKIWGSSGLGKKGKPLLRKRGSGCTLHPKPIFKETKHKDKALGEMDSGDIAHSLGNAALTHSLGDSEGYQF